MSEPKSSPRPEVAVDTVVSSDFINGYLAATQFIGITMGEETLAEYALQESGFKCKEFIFSQKNSGFETRRMNKIIRRALSC